MTFIRPLFLFLLSVSIVGINSGCATLPNVSKKIDAAQTNQKSSQIVLAEGLLSLKQSKAVMERLERCIDPTDILERYTAVVESVTDSPLTKGNKVTLLADGQATYAAMFKAMQSAKDYINIETFIIDDDDVGNEFSDLMLKKQAEGVQVNLIYDSVGSYTNPAAFFQRLRDGGIQVVEFNPINPLKAQGGWLLGHQDHRKILIVDGKIAITGGINISSVYSSRLSGRHKDTASPLPWRDTDVQIEGPAAAELQKLFLDTWSKQNGPKLPECNYYPRIKEEGNSLVQIIGSSQGAENRITFIAYVAAITFAEHSIHLTNAYFIPDDQILKAFTDAAKRGIDVKIILPGTTDSAVALYAARYNYSGLLESGVKIYERRNALLHAKTAVIDNVWSTVGSTNMDYWSLLSNDEVNAVILCRQFAGEMENTFAKDLEESFQIKREEWEERPLSSKIGEWFAHLLVLWL